MSSRDATGNEEPTAYERPGAPPDRDAHATDTSGPTTVPPGGPGATLPMATPLPAPGGLLGRGVAVGRYLVVSVLGKGGMGVVYAAYDPELDRRIALKLLRGHGAGGSSGRQRMQREAQGLARLSHPNVIAIHDVGTHDDGLFIAMELVDGTTLRRWQRDRPWRDVVDAYLAAGRGLAAAHAANLVHRDFKPENVLVGTDGRVRVTDFGLVRADRRGDSTDGAATDEDHRPNTAPATPATASLTPSVLTSDLTEAGALLGTPHYMAPEQLDGGLADERSDQFAFCVAAWEAICGERPFRGHDVASLGMAVRGGPPRVSARWARGAVLRVLARGLLADPARRWPSMSALIAGIERALARRRRIAATAGVVSTGVAIAGLIAIAAAPGRATCDTAGDDADALWPALRADVERSLGATGAPFAADAFAAVDRAAVGWSDQWRAMAVESCRATRVSRVQSAALLDLRTACLSGRLDQARALLGSLRDADPARAEGAPALAANLPELGACADAAALTARAPRPSDPAMARRLDAVEDDLATLAGEAHRAASPDALRALRDRADVLVAEARRLGWRPAEAAALLVAADLAHRASDGAAARTQLVAAAAAATAGDDAARLAEALIDLVDIDTSLRSAYDDATAWATLAEGALVRLTSPGRLATRLRWKQGLLASAQAHTDEARDHLIAALDLAEKSHGAEHDEVVSLLVELAELEDNAARYDQAAAYLERAVPLAERVYGAAHPTQASLRHEQGTVAYHRGDWATAIARYREAVALRERALGPEARPLANDLAALGTALLSHGDSADAIATYQRSLALAERAYGPDHVEVAGILNEIGGAYNRTGDHAASLAANRRALAIRERVLGAEHPDVAYSLVNVAIESKALGQMAVVEPSYRRAIAIFEKALGSDHPTTGIATLNLAELLRVTGRLDAAATAYERARTVLTTAMGADHPVLSHVWNGLGQLALARGRAREAVPLLEKAVAMREADAGDAPALAEARLALARALRATGDPARARTLATQARDAWRAIGGDFADEAAAADAFLRR